MLSVWKESPFIRVLLPFVSGILTYLLLPSGNLPAIVIAVLVFLLSIFLFNVVKDYYRLKYAYIKGLLIHFFIASSAYLICIFHHQPNSKEWYKKYSPDYPYAVVKINAPPELKEKTMKAEVIVKQLCDSNEYMKTSGNAFVYFQKSEKNNSIRQGDFILIKNKLKDIRKSGNPGSFDYAAYCASKNIFQSAYIKEEEWQAIDKHEENYITFFARISEYTRSILRKNIPDTNAQGIAEALLVGYRADIDDETWQAYSSTGIAHIIAISGMHMAMIYGSTRWLLLLIPFFKKRKKITLLIAIVFMWAFACITGLPASVTRAAIMFTFIGWGEMQQQKANTLNMLAASAFCMLAYNPMIILDTGFQLSYLAVLSLVLFYTPVYNLLFIPKRLPDLIWKFIAMTIAAQILTFPLCIYYFHQFPLLFIFTNLFAVPLTTLILYTEIVLVFVHYITPVATFLGKIISLLISFVNNTVLALSHLTFAVWSEIHISWLQMTLLFLIIAFISIWLFYKRNQSFILATCSFFIFCLTLLHREFTVLHQQKVIIYNIAGQRSIEFIAGNKFYNPDIDSLHRKKKNETYTLNPSHTFFSVKKSDKALITNEQETGVEIFSFKGCRIMRIEQSNFKAETPLSVDLLIISNRCEIDSGWLSQNINPKKIILDSSIPFWKIEKLKMALANTTIPVYTVQEQGAFILNI